MKRIIFNQLQQWKHDKNRKPLILMGARQVGKTYILSEFGRSEYEQYVYLNFEDQPQLNELFKQGLAPQQLLQAITIETQIKIEPGSTLIIFDEIQECPEALNSLKYFNEQANEYHICAAGSLLGVKLTHTKGFPVGKVNFLELYPLCFLEFLAAINQNMLQQYIRSLTDIEPLPANLHEKLTHFFKTYLLIGGMPEAVKTFIETEDFEQVRTVQQNILKAYTLDFAKHAPANQVMKISQVWRAIPNQLAKENKKFIYSVIRQGTRAKDFEIAIQWLKEAGLIYKVYNLATPKLPLDAYAKFDFFKIYMLDVGLLAAMVDLSAKTILYDEQIFQEFRGSFVENYVTQELARNNFGLYYWTSEGKAELDFVIQYENTVLPLEVKSGNSEKKKSLRAYADKFNPALLLRSSPRNLKHDADLVNVPLYLLGCLPELLSKLLAN